MLWIGRRVYTIPIFTRLWFSWHNRIADDDDAVIVLLIAATLVSILCIRWFARERRRGFFFTWNSNSIGQSQKFFFRWEYFLSTVRSVNCFVKSLSPRSYQLLVFQVQQPVSLRARWHYVYHRCQTSSSRCLFTSKCVWNIVLLLLMLACTLVGDPMLSYPGCLLTFISRRILLLC